MKTFHRFQSVCMRKEGSYCAARRKLSAFPMPASSKAHSNKEYPYFIRKLNESFVVGVASGNQADNVRVANRDERYGEYEPIASMLKNDPYMISMGGCVIPCLSKGPKSAGEDAIYFRKIGHSMAVADGVGSWKDANVDPGEYSREFLASMKFKLETESVKRDPVVALEYADTNQTKKGTACVCVLTLDGKNISTANIGDTKFLLLRQESEMIGESNASTNGGAVVENDEQKSKIKGESEMNKGPLYEISNRSWNVIYKSTEMQHSWNYPVQIGTDSKTKPKDASLVTLPVKPGDVIIMASDGVFDNLFVNDIRMIVSEFPWIDNKKQHQLSDSMQLLAEKIAIEAQKCSLNPSRLSPYSKLAQRYSYSYMVSACCFDSDL